MTDRKIQYSKTIGGHPVQRFLQKALDFEHESGFASPLRVTYPSYDFECLYVIEGDELIAAMSFERRAYMRSFQVQLCYVEPEHRRKGLHTLLFNTLCAMAKRDGYLRVCRSVSAKNWAMIKAIESQRCERTSHSYEFLIDWETCPASLDDRFEVPG